MTKNTGGQSGSPLRLLNVGKNEDSKAFVSSLILTITGTLLGCRD